MNLPCSRGWLWIRGYPHLSRLPLIHRPLAPSLFTLCLASMSVQFHLDFSFPGALYSPQAPPTEVGLASAHLLVQGSSLALSSQGTQTGLKLS